MTKHSHSECALSRSCFQMSYQEFLHFSSTNQDVIIFPHKPPDIFNFMIKKMFFWFLCSQNVAHHLRFFSLFIFTPTHLHGVTIAVISITIKPCKTIALDQKW